MSTICRSFWKIIKQLLDCQPISIKFNKCRRSLCCCDGKSDSLLIFRMVPSNHMSPGWSWLFGIHNLIFIIIVNSLAGSMLMTVRTMNVQYIFSHICHTVNCIFTSTEPSSQKWFIVPEIITVEIQLEWGFFATAHCTIINLHNDHMSLSTRKFHFPRLLSAHEGSSWQNEAVSSKQWITSKH